MTNYNIDLQVPVIIRAPKQRNRGAHTYALTELVDLFPTICELAGIEIPTYMQGLSMAPLMDKPDRDWKTAAFSQFHRRPKVSADGQRYMGYSINTKTHHYIEWYDWDHEEGLRGNLRETELYDRIHDPHETVNISFDENHIPVMNELSQKLARGWQGALPQ